MNPHVLVQRMVRAAKLEPQVYEEVEHDRSATFQAVVILVVVSIAAALGSMLVLRFSAMALLTTFVSFLLAWVVFSVVAWLVGTRLFGGKANAAELLRVLGFAWSPMVLAVIPWLGALVGVVWSLVCSVIAVRQALDVSTEKAIGTIVVGILPAIIVIVILERILL